MNMQEEVSFETKVLSSGWKTDWISKTPSSHPLYSEGEMVKGEHEGHTPERKMLVAAIVNNLFNYWVCAK